MTISLSQAWLNKVSRHESNESFVVGHKLARSESSVNTDDLILSFSKTPAAQEIIRRGWLGIERRSKDAVAMIRSIEEMLFAAPVPAAIHFRGSGQPFSQEYVKQLATMMWLQRTRGRAEHQSVGLFDLQSVDAKAVNELVQCSSQQNGPLLAVEWFKQRGIRFVVESSLPGMRLDGVATALESGKPMIAITVRYDRLDNFWFTVLHELGHVVRHLGANFSQTFVDDLDGDSSEDETEGEANAYARDALIPRDMWRRSDAFRLRTKSAVVGLAKELRISPAIIAGRLQKETGNYGLFRELLGQGAVRELLIEQNATE